MQSVHFTGGDLTDGVHYCTVGRRAIGVGGHEHDQVFLPFIALLVKTLKKVGAQFVVTSGQVAGSVPRQRQAEST